MILLLSNGLVDRSIEELYLWIKFFKGNVAKINSIDLCNDMKIKVEITNPISNFFISDKNEIIKWEDINVIWYWRWHEYDLSNLYNPLCKNYTIRNFLYRECETISSYTFNKLKDKKWYGNKSINKLIVLEEAICCGLNIPSTIITTQRNDLLCFYNKHKNIIIKPLSDPIFINKNGRRFAMYTSILEKEDIFNLPSTVFPLCCQEYIKKDYEIRIFYLDKKFYSAAILSQQDERTRVDFRNYNLETPNRIIPYKLPNEIESKLQKLMIHLQLSTGSIDLIYKEGIYYFLEVNPVGQYDMISSPCNYNLSSLIAKFLISNDLKNG